MIVYGYKFRPAFGVSGDAPQHLAVDVREPENARRESVPA